MTISYFPTVWVRAQDLLLDPYLLSDGDPVATWKGPPSGSFEQGTSSKQPIFKENQVNGYPAVEFVRAGTPDWMDYSTTLGSGASGRTIIVVSRKIGAAAQSPGGDRYWACGSNASMVAALSSADDFAGYGAESQGIDVVVFPRVLASAAFNVYSVRVASTTSAQIYTNLIAGEHFDPWTDDISSDSAFRIGAQLDEANAISAQFAEIIIINQSLPDATFKGVVYGLMVKYAIPVDVTNPFGISFSLAQSLGLTTSVSLDSLSVLVPPATSTTSGTVRTDVDDPNGDPVVYLKESVDALLDTKVELGGQIGGTITSPEILGVRETSGPTLLTMDDVADGQFLKRSGSLIVSAAVTGGGGGGGAVAELPIDAAASAAVGSGDLFGGTSLDGGWSDLQTTAVTSKDRSVDGYLILKNTGNTSGQDRGIKRTFSPAGDFTVYCKILNRTGGYQYVWAGLFVGASDPSDGAGGNRAVLTGYDAGSVNNHIKSSKMAAGAETVIADNAVNAVSNSASRDNGPAYPCWMRIKRVGSTISYGVSYEGVQFIDLPSTTTISFTVDTIGLFIGESSDSKDIRAVFDYIATTG
jgi:hypothetical protein